MKKPLIIFLLISVSFTLKARNYYFSSSGLDSRTNVEAQNKFTPWLSIAKLNGFFNQLLPGDSVLFKRGETFYGTIIINKSGTSSSSINVGSYGKGARAVITSMIELSWTSIGNNIYRSVEVISVPYMNLLTINNLPVSMGRWPNLDRADSGYNSVSSSTTASITDAVGLKVTGRPANFIGAEIKIRTKRFWIIGQKIIGFSGSTFTFSKASAADDNPTDGMGYFIQNSPYVLDQNTEWYYNPATAKIDIFSDTGNGPANVSAASLDNLVKSASSNYITFSDLNFNGCNSDAFRLDNGSRITVNNCIIQNVGRNGVRTGASYTSVLNDSIVNCLSKGVTLIEGADHATVRYNEIRNIGQLIGHNNGNREDGRGNHSGVGIYISGSNADNPTVEHNKIINTGHNGIHFVRQQNIVIQYNNVDSTDNVLDDGGGIYGYTGDNTQTSSTTIRYNIIKNGIGAPNGTGRKLVFGEGVAGIYLDKGVSNALLEFNTIVKFNQGIFANVGTNNNVISNNTIYDCNFDLQVNTRGANQTRLLHITNNLCIALKITQVNISIVNSNAAPAPNLNMLGFFDSNYYYRPLSIPPATSLRWTTTSVNNVSLITWQAKFPYSKNSVSSPVYYKSQTVQDTSLRLVYNASGKPLTIQLFNECVNVKGVRFETGSIVLLPFDSQVLFRTGELLPPLKKVILYRRKFQAI